MNPQNVLVMCRDPRPVVAEGGRLLAAQMRLPRKVLVTDLDGTLWRGVVAETDVLDPNAKAYDALAAIRERGGLLAVATWNDANVVLSLPLIAGLDLRIFAAIECGYDPKPVMLRRIAERLNLSADSFVFVDDDPMQRAHVAQELPGVIVLTPADDPVPYFEPVTLTAEDRRRAEMYEEDRQRRLAMREAEDPQAFLRSLGLVVRIERAKPEQRARVDQLLTRTTQFNLTGWTSGEHEPDLVLVASAADRFGEYGLVAALIADEADYGRYWIIRNVVLSCRALGRGIETALMRSFLDRAAPAMERTPGGLCIEAAFSLTPRNAPASEFLERHGFHQSVSGYWLLRDRDRVPRCDHLTVEDIP